MNNLFKLACACVAASWLPACTQHEAPMTPANSAEVSADSCPRKSETLTITDVQPERDFDHTLREKPGYATASDVPQRRSGARIRLAAQEGVNIEWVQRLTECEILGYAQGAKKLDARDPLAVQGADVEVYPGDAGYILELSAPTEAAGDELYRRSVALMQQPESSWEIGL